MNTPILFSKLRLIGFILLFIPGWVFGQFSEGFETGMPASYTTGFITLSSGTWNATNISSSTVGVQTGTYSCKLKSVTNANIISPNISSSGVGTVTFYASVNSGTGYIQVNYSLDGGTSWNAATDSPFSLSTSINQKTATINSISSNILVQFRRTAGTVLIDDVVIYSYTTWTGATNQDWSTSSNWSNGVPTANYNVNITSGLSNYPIISSATSADCNDLNIESGASLTIQSDASNNGSLIVSGTSSGNITYNRWMTGVNNWHLISAPVGGQSINSLVTDVANSIAYIDPKYGLAPYDNSNAAWDHYTSSTISDAGNFTAAKGYEILRTSSGTVGFTGTVATADVSIAITTNSNAWNLVGNPFTSAINANTSTNFITENTSALGAGAYQAIYIWDADAGTPDYLTINLSSGATYIAPDQAFFVNSASASTTVNFTKAMQIHQTGNIFKSEKASFPSIKLIAKSAGVKTTTNIKYIDDMTTGLDPGYDAGRFSGGDNTFAIYTHLIGDSENQVDFDIQCLPNSDLENMVVPVGLNAKAGEVVTFSASTFDIPNDYVVVLEDRAVNTFTDLSEEGGQYSIRLTDDSNEIGRFFVHASFKSALGIGDLVTPSAFQVFAQSKQNQLLIRGEATENTVARIFSITGRQMTVVNLKQAGENRLPFNGESGVYIVQITNKNGIYSQKFAWIK